MEKYRERKKNLHMVFIDLEKDYDSIPRNIWDSLPAKGISRMHIEAMWDMYEGATSSIEILIGLT